MLSKEEVLDIISYCAEKGISRKVRLKELGIPVWQFYYSRDRWLEKERSEPVGEGKFIELRRSGRFIPASVRPPKMPRPTGLQSYTPSCPHAVRPMSIPGNGSDMSWLKSRQERNVSIN